MEEFIAWALDPARSNDEKYTVELIVEAGMAIWHAQHNTGVYEDVEAREERNRQRKLNPAYLADYSKEDLLRTAEILAGRKEWSHFPYSERPMRDLKAFGFLALETLDLSWCDASDLSPIAKISSLRSFTFRSPECHEFGVLAACQNLRKLNLTFSVPWPEVKGLELLQGLEEISLNGNLLAFAPGTSWGKVRRGTLSCTPLAARSYADLPLLPACEYLTISGVDRLEGIERMPRLRNLTLNGPVRDLSPLAALAELTCFSLTGDKPRDISPLTRLPKLQFVQFGELHKPNKPRDYSPLAEAPLLRELIVLGCPPVEMEVSAINAGLAHWDDLLFVEPPRPLEALRMIVAPASRQPFPSAPDSEPAGASDEGLAACEARWVAAYLHQQVEQLTGLPHWGAVRVNGVQRTFFVEIYALEAVEIFAEVVRTLREGLARLRHEFTGTLMIMLQNPPIKPTPAEIQEEERLQELENNAYYEQWRRDQEEYQDRLHRYELKKEEGGPIDPAEFTVPEPQADPFWTMEEGENEDEIEDEEDEGEFSEEPEQEDEVVEEFQLDNEHPMADHYRLLALIKLNEVWFLPHHRGLAVHLMGTEPDLEIAEL